MAVASTMTLNGLEPVDSVLARVQRRKNLRRDVLVQRPEDLQFQMRVAGIGYGTDTLTMTIDGVEMPLTQGAIKTAAAIIDQKKPGWFEKFADPQFFPKLFRNYQHTRGFLIRHDGSMIYSVLPDNYQVLDAAEFLAGHFLPSLEEHFGDIKGIAHVMGGNDDGDMDSFRIVCGDNLVDGVDPEMGQHVMFMLSTSDNGLADTKTSVGLYRPVSTTAAIRQQTNAKWGHKSDPTEFFGKSGESIRGTKYYWNAFSGHFSEMARTPLPTRDGDSEPMDCAGVLNLLKVARLITAGHYDSAKLYANSLTEDNRPRDTLYDCFNCLALGARDLLNLEQRQKAEEVTMTLFTSKGGLVEQIKRGLER